MLQYREERCIRTASTGLITLGSENRPVNDEGWRGIQITGDRHAIAFSLLPVEVAFSGEDAVVLAPPIVAMTRPMGGYTRAPLCHRGQRTIFIAVDTSTAQEIVAVHDASAADREDPFPARSGPCSSRALAMAWQLERLAFAADSLPEPIEMDELAMQIISSSLEAYYQSCGIVTRNPRKLTRNTQRSRVDRAIALMCIAPEQRWTLSEIAADVSLSTAYLSRIFKRHTGRTLSRCLKLIRVMRALEQLPDRRGNLTALALDWGFASHAHMTAAFKSILGAPPSLLAENSSQALRDSLGILQRQLHRW